MNIFIIHAHENKHSFCSALKDTAKEYFISKGHSVQISDLYNMNFNPVAGKNDFKELSKSDYYKLQAEQVNAYKEGLYSEDIKTEMDKTEWADVIIFNFPLWWFSVPAILKGWVDRVFAMGFAYGAGKGVYKNGVWPDKKAFVTVTTGGPEKAYGNSGNNGVLADILYHVNHGMFYFTGMKVLPPFIAFGPARLNEDERKNILNNYTKYLSELEEHKAMYPL